MKIKTKYRVEDGIVNTERYGKSGRKILWILKECNDEENKEGWDLREFLRHRSADDQGLFNYPRWHATWGKVIRISYGVIYNKDIPDIPKAKEIAHILDEIAVINVKKIPGGSKANHEEMRKHFHLNKETLRKEIESMNPDVVLCGNTMHFFEKEGGLTFPNGKGEWGGKAHDGRYWIDGYHPSYYKCTDAEYLEGVMSVLKS